MAPLPSLQGIGWQTARLALRPAAIQLCDRPVESDLRAYWRANSASNKRRREDARAFRILISHRWPLASLRSVSLAKIISAIIEIRCSGINASMAIDGEATVA